MTEVTLIGLLLAVVSAFFNGTFSMLGKLLKEEPDPIIFNTMLCMGVFVSGLLTIPFFPLVAEEGDSNFPLGWTWPGALAGALLVGATLFSFIAIPLAGLATAAATWSCSAIVVAFLWGAFGPEGISQESKSLPLAILAIVILVLGAVILNLKDQLAALISSGQAASASQQGLELSFDPQQNGDADSSGAGGSNKPLGILSALTVGIFGGSILVPSHYVRKELQGLPLLPSFGCGAAVVGILVALIYWVFIKKEPLSLKSDSALAHALRREVVLSGMFSGLLWNISNVAQVLAMDKFHMPYGVSYPILQCGLLIAGVWGIYVFKEVEACKPKIMFWLGGLVLMIGVLMLGLFGPGTYTPCGPCVVPTTPVPTEAMTII